MSKGDPRALPGAGQVIHDPPPKPPSRPTPNRDAYPSIRPSSDVPPLRAFFEFHGHIAIHEQYSTRSSSRGRTVSGTSKPIMSGIAVFRKFDVVLSSGTIRINSGLAHVSEPPPPIRAPSLDTLRNATFAQHSSSVPHATSASQLTASGARLTDVPHIVSLGAQSGGLMHWNLPSLEFRGVTRGLRPPWGGLADLRGGGKTSMENLQGAELWHRPGGGFERLFLLPSAVLRRRPPRFTSRGKSLVALTLSLLGRRLQGPGRRAGGGKRGFSPFC